MKFLSVAICLITIMACKENNTNETLSPEAQKIQDLVLQQKQLFDIPGIAVGMMINDTIVYHHAHGVKGLDSQAPLTTKSLFHMASVSKPFVATAIVQLVEQGKIDLDEKLTDYLPYFVMDDERYKDITIRQMLNHTSGIPNVKDYEWDKPEYDDGAAERYSRSHKSLKLDFTPGSQYDYSNAAFDILCDVIAKASGITFEDYMTKHIFEPVGMTNSTFFKPDVPKDLATIPHVIGDSLDVVVSEIYPYNRRHAGSSTLHSNVEDMLLWAKVNLNKGIINGNRIYKESSYDLLTTTQAKINDTRSVGLSWFLNDLDGDKIVFHQGGDTGYSTFFAFVPAKKSAIALMVNADFFWSNYASSIILKNTLSNDSIHVKAPIHLKLKDYILKDGISKTKAVYFAEEKKPVQDYFFGASYLDDLGYWLMDRDYSANALDVFKFAVELEPKYSGWPDSVADAYKALDSIDLAITWYKKALELDPEQDFTIKKLNELLKQHSK